MQKNICAICLQPVELNSDILQQNDDIKCVHYSCLNQSQVGQQILAKASCQHQSNEQKTIGNTSLFNLSKRPAFRKLPFKQISTSECVLTRSKEELFPVQEYSVNREVYSRTSKSFYKTYSSSSSSKWFSTMRKHSYRIMPLFIRNRYLLRKSQKREIPQSKKGEETTIFPFTIDASDVYSSEILDWLASQNKNEVPNPINEKPQSESRQHKKKVTIQDTCDPFLIEHRNRDYRKSQQRRASRRSRREMPTISIGSQYSNHSHKLNAADFMDWVTSAPKIPNGNMLILLDCRNKKDTKNIAVQPSFNHSERILARKTAESLILDLLDARKTNGIYEYYPKCEDQESSASLVKNCTIESRISTSLKERDLQEVDVMEELYPETVEDRLHHVVSVVFSVLSQFSGLVCRMTRVIKDEFTYGGKTGNPDKKSKV